MINDTIDILDGRVVNLQIEFVAVADIDENKFQILARAKEALATRMFRTKYDMGEAFIISDIFSVLKNVDGVLDVKDVNVSQKHGSLYSTFMYRVEPNITPDGRLIKIPENAVFEIRYPNSDIVGSII